MSPSENEVSTCYKGSVYKIQISIDHHVSRIPFHASEIMNSQISMRLLDENFQLDWSGFR